MFAAIKRYCEKRLDGRTLFRRLGDAAAGIGAFWLSRRLNVADIPYLGTALWFCLIVAFAHREEAHVPSDRVTRLPTREKLGLAVMLLTAGIVLGSSPFVGIEYWTDPWRFLAVVAAVLVSMAISSTGGNRVRVPVAAAADADVPRPARGG
jgi:hypothetical protein